MTYELSDFVENLKFYRKEKHLTQEKLAEKCDCETATIGGIEIGRQAPSFNMICKIANALEIHPADLFLRNASSVSTKLKDTLETRLTSDIKEILETYFQGE